jgi:hypothetical protein
MTAAVGVFRELARKMAQWICNILGCRSGKIRRASAQYRREGRRLRREFLAFQPG